VISEWQLELPANPAQREPLPFDYETISDVVLHLRYTAREGGGLLRNGAIENLKTSIDEARSAGSVRLFSVRHEFPSEWARFKAAQPAANERAELSVELREEHYPFWSKGRLEAARRIDLFARTDIATLNVTEKRDGSGSKDAIGEQAFDGIRRGRLVNIPFPKPTGPLTLYLSDNSISNLWIGVTFGKA
jgi:hypothetical protein